MDFTNHAQNFGKYVFQSGISLNVLGTKFQVICRFIIPGSSGNKGTLKTWYLKMYGTADPPVSSDSIKQPPVPACSIECQNGCTGPRADQCKECKHFRSSTNNVRESTAIAVLLSTLLCFVKTKIG